MNLLTFPPEVLQHCLLPFLQWNDLLRLRRVSKASKLLVQDYLKVNPQLAPEIEIGDKEMDRNLKAFLDLELPVPPTKIFLDNSESGSGFYQGNSEELSEFLEVYGSVVTHLRVYHFSLYCSGMERQFLEGLVNLQSFEVEWFNTAKDSGVDMLPVPRVFGNVTVLKLQNYGDGTNGFGTDENGYNALIELLSSCRMLQNFHPQSIFIYEDIKNGLVTKLVRFLTVAIQQREDNPEGAGATLSKLKVIDLGNSCLEDYVHCLDEDEPEAAKDYLQFLTSCADHGIQLSDVVSDNYLESFARHRGNVLMNLDSLSIYEMYNDWTWIMKVEMPMLKRLRLWIPAPPPEFMEPEYDTVISRNVSWPMLKRLELKFEGLYGELKLRAEKDKDYVQFIRNSTQEVFQLLFEGINRTALTELEFTFSGEDEVLVPIPECLSTCCPNLRKLKLSFYNGNDEQFVRLWEGLLNLEEITLRSCANLGDAGFIGPDAQNPVLLNLKRLRYLKLRHLHDMPGITDKLFSSVIRHLGLTHFKITSDDPSENVTTKGIMSLLGGRFEETIQKFSFDDRSFIDYTPAVNRNLQKLFAHRLSNMV